MKNIILAAITLGLSSTTFAAGSDVCGKVKKIEQNSQQAWEVTLDSGKVLPAFIGFSDGFVLQNALVIASLTSNLTVCFRLQTQETLYDVVSASK